MIRDNFRCQSCDEDEEEDLLVRKVFDGPRTVDTCAVLCVRCSGRVSFCKYVERLGGHGGYLVGRQRLRQAVWERCYLQNFRNELGAFHAKNNPDARDRRDYPERNR